ncbi:hypothetical protein lerEdw1_017307 [Lerista edwardsae]|nr:hypothetical protein lerEdw1_017307 [Lerista edwardsae]
MSVLTPILTPPELKEYLSKGERFIKWDDVSMAAGWLSLRASACTVGPALDTTVASPVILRVDPKGFFLYWTFQSKDMEFLDITSIRDTRVGKFAKIPKQKVAPGLATQDADARFSLQSQKLREVFNLDFPDNNFLLKTLTVVSGPDMVDLTFHNFVSYKENVGKAWADDIMAISRNPFTYNASRYRFLEKILVKLKLQLNAEGKIPVRK